MQGVYEAVQQAGQALMALGAPLVGVSAVVGASLGWGLGRLRMQDPQLVTLVRVAAVGAAIALAASWAGGVLVSTAHSVWETMAAR